MDDAEDDIPRQQLVALFTEGTLFTEAELLDLVGMYSLEELALITAAYSDEAFLYLQDPDASVRSMLEFAADIGTHLSEDDRMLFGACLNETDPGIAAESPEVLERIPSFEYVKDGERIAVRILFPDTDEDG